MFPFTLYGCNDGAGGFAIAQSFLPLFLKHKAEELFWRETDTIILAPDKIRFEVFDNAGSWSGFKRGELIAVYEVDCDPADTRRAIQDEAIERAAFRMREEERRAREYQLAVYTNEILDAVYKDKET